MKCKCCCRKRSNTRTQNTGLRTPGQTKIKKILALGFTGLALALFIAARERLPASGQVARVVDGDTIVLESGEHLRYIGIDSPEHDDTLFAEARTLNQKFVEGKTVRLEYDVTKRDGYGRLLAYVWLDQQMVNLELVKAGLARVYTFPPNVRYAQRFMAAQKEARSRKAGMWGIPVWSLEAYYVGNSRSLKFHRPQCRQARRLKSSEKVKFSSRDAALDSGYAPCRNCKP